MRAGVHVAPSWLFPRNAKAEIKVGGREAPEGSEALVPWYDIAKTNRRS